MGKTIWAIVILVIIGLLGITYAQIEQTKSLLGSLESQVAANANKVVAAITPTPTLKPASYLIQDFGLLLPVDPDKVTLLKTSPDYRELAFQPSQNENALILRFYKVKAFQVASVSKLNNWTRTFLKSDPNINYPLSKIVFVDHLPFVGPIAGQSCGYDRSSTAINLTPPLNDTINPYLNSFYIVYPQSEDYSIVFNAVFETTGAPGCPRVLPLPLQS